MWLVVSVGLCLDASPSSSCVHGAQNRGWAGVSWSSVYTHHIDRIYKPGLRHGSVLPYWTIMAIFFILNYYYFISIVVVFTEPCSCVSRFSPGFGLTHYNFMFSITPCKAMWHSTSLSEPGFHGRLMCSSSNEALLDIPCLFLLRSIWYYCTHSSSQNTAVLMGAFMYSSGCSKCLSAAPIL